MEIPSKTMMNVENGRKNTYKIIQDLWLSVVYNMEAVCGVHMETVTGMLVTNRYSKIS